MTGGLTRWAGWLAILALGWAFGGLPATLTVIVLRTAHRALRRRVAERYQMALRGTAEDVLAALATELDAGGAPDEALRTALSSVGELPARPVDRAASRPRGGGRPSGRSGHRQGRRSGRRPAPLDLPRLRELLTGVDDPGRLLARSEAASLRQLATAYRVCRLTGVRLAPVATMLADTARSDSARADELAAALAGPRSSGRLVAGLPLLGVALGALLGAAPLEVLVTPPLGTGCLAAGVLLDLVGLRWLRRIADGVQAQVLPVCAGPVEPGWRRDGTVSGEYRRRLLADLPLALDLVAACLRSGATTQHALEVVGLATGGAAGAELRAAGLAMRHGASAAEACDRLLATIGVRRPELRALPDSPGIPGSAASSALVRLRARVRQACGLPATRGSGRQREARVVLAATAAIGRTESSGAKLATTLTRISTRARQETHTVTIAAARRAGVMAVAPLGLCFLPAFLLLGVVPVVIGSAPDLGPAFPPAA